ncbi:MAG: hypothetical protein DCF28_08590 [Alphaproteobacteria bacterium]|nr:MAG: hypothetical protein DCF28_08590 [Alphaproteobacteria bacterium]PZO41587.1 MAG: hypothetical protein DCE92_00155 [Alphaproteobacteria bacterium]
MVDFSVGAPDRDANAALDARLLDASIGDNDIEGFLFGQNVDFLLDSLAIFSKLFDGDITSMLIFFTMARCSVNHLNREKVPRAEATEGVFSDTFRRPVAILSISDYLNLPYETTRRHVMKLVERGLCRRQGSRKFLITAETLSRPEFRALARQTVDLSKTYLQVIGPFIDTYGVDPARVALPSQHNERPPRLQPTADGILPIVTLGGT